MFDYEEVQQGDLVDFDAYDKLYVCNPDRDEKTFWVTNKNSDRYDSRAPGWSIRKSFSKMIIED